MMPKLCVNDPNIIDVDPTELKDIPNYEREESKMIDEETKNNGEESKITDEKNNIEGSKITDEKNNGVWTKMPTTDLNEESSKKGVKVVEVKSSKSGKRGRKLLKRVGAIGIALLLLNAYKDDLINLYKNSKNNSLDDINKEDNLKEDLNYDKALADNGAILDEEVKSVEETKLVDERENNGAYDEVIGGKVLAFTNPYDDDQVYARAGYINTYLQASNVNNKTNDELFDQVKFVCGTYNASNDDEAWDVYNDFLQTIADYSVATEQSNNFAGGVVDDNGVRVALGLDAFLPDNCEHRELMDELSLAFQNVLSANTIEEKMDASRQMLKLEADLKEGMKETPDGTKIYFTSLSSSEGMIAGLMFQLSNAIIRSALGENITITYKDNIGQDVEVTLNFLETYYNPQCNGEYDTENVWAKCCIDLVQTAINKGEITLSR